MRNKHATRKNSTPITSACIGEVAWAVLPVIVWAGVIFFLSHQPQLPHLDQAWSDFFIKKTAHVLVYAVLFFLVQRAQFKLMPETKQHRTALSVLTPLSLTIAYAVLDEVHQSFVPGRMPSFQDILFDAFGAMMVLLWTNKNFLRDLLDLNSKPH